MNFDLKALMRNTALLLLVLSMFAFCATVFQAVMASRLATETVQAYAPTIERQAVALIVEALPKNEKGNQAAYLAQALATNVESQHTALSRAVQSQAAALTHQAGAWAAMSILALFAYFESRRRTPSAA